MTRSKTWRGEAKILSNSSLRLRNLNFYLAIAIKCVFQGGAVSYPSKETLDPSAEDGARHGVVQPAEEDHELEEGQRHQAIQLRQARADDKVRK